MPEHPITDPYPLRDRTFHGLGVWEMGEEGDQGVMIEGHGRRSLAALNAYGRDLYGPDWRRLERLHFTPTNLWVLTPDTCGCTDDQHEQHVADAAGTEWAPFCDDCEHYGLPPCRDEYGWMAVHVQAGTPGALAMTEAQW